MSRLLFFALLFFRLSLPAQIVLFPGDTNNDGSANEYDILPIGVAYGSEGFPRPDASLLWQPQLMPQPWLVSLPVSGINLAFADTDGNGFIDSLDMDAIAFNFDSLQFQSQPPPLPYVLPDTCFSCPNPNLLITFDRDTALVTDTFFAILTLEYPAAVPLELRTLGLAFELNYDPENVKDSLTRVFPDTMPGDLMFATATTALATAWRNVPPGNIRFGAAGKAQNALFATRELGRVAIVVDDMIIRSVSAEAQFWMAPSNILLINKDEQVVGLGNVVVDTILLYDPADPVAEVENWKQNITLSPNPAGDWVRIDSPGAMIRAVEVFGENGSLILKKHFAPAYSHKLDLEGIAEGVYFLRIENEKGWAAKRLLKI